MSGNQKDQAEVDVEEGKEEGEVEVVITAEAAVWDITKAVRRFTDGQGKKKWQCLFCGNTWNGWNATKALWHVARKGHKDIKDCKAKVKEEMKIVFDEMRHLWELKNTKKAERRESVETYTSKGDETIQSMAVALEQSQKRSSKSLGRLKDDKDWEHGGDGDDGN